MQRTNGDKFSLSLQPLSQSKIILNLQCARTPFIRNPKLALTLTLSFTRTPAAIPVDQTLQYGVTPLMWAAIEGNVDMARVLINHKAKVDALTKVRPYPIPRPNRFPSGSGRSDTSKYTLNRALKPRPLA